MEDDNVIFNFSDVYREETFYMHDKFKWIDCTDIKGADCFCDNDAAEEIRRRMSEEVEDTNWDQGKAILKDLKHALSILLQHDRVIGVDICGECQYSLQGLIDPNLVKDNEVNSQLASLFENSQI